MTARAATAGCLARRSPPRRSTRSSRPELRLSARFRSSARTSRAEDPVLPLGKRPEIASRSVCQVPGCLTPC
jgi:hypothetical protein